MDARRPKTRTRACARLAQGATLDHRPAGTEASAAKLFPERPASTADGRTLNPPNRQPPYADPHVRWCDRGSL